MSARQGKRSSDNDQQSLMERPMVNLALQHRKSSRKATAGANGKVVRLPYLGWRGREKKWHTITTTTRLSYFYICFSSSRKRHDKLPDQVDEDNIATRIKFGIFYSSSIVKERRWRYEVRKYFRHLSNTLCRYLTAT